MAITLTGANHFLLRTELGRIVDAFVAEHGDLALEKLDGEEAPYERIQEALQSLPFLAAKKLVVLKNGSANKEFTDNIEHIIDSVPDSTEVIIVEPKLDKRLGYYKTLKKRTDFKEYPELDSPGLANWLVQAAKERGGALKPADARYLVERVGANQQLLHNELEKLIFYKPDITRGAIDMLTEAAPQSSIFELLDAAFAGNTKRALELYQDQRAQQMEPQYILAMLAWQLHILALVKTAGQRSPEDIAREARLSPYVVRKSLGITRKLSLDRLKELVAGALEIDVRLKSQSIDADEALQHYLLTLSIQAN
jgi:DNA polymerase-3 subunit delta